MDKIKVTVYFTGLIDIKNLHSGDTVELNSGSSISDLYGQIGIREEHKKYIIAMINGKNEFMHYTLKDRDEVKLFLPVGGG